MTIRLLLMLSALFYTVTVFPADGASSTQSITEAFGGGNGTDTEPYVISTVSDMLLLANNVSAGVSYEGQHFIVDAEELDFSNETYIPVGESASLPFAGSFDGRNVVIKGLSLYRDGYAGLFGYVAKTGSVSNIVVDESCIIQGGTDVGSIVGANEGFISTCTNRAEVSASRCRIGGICGDNMGTVSDCFNYGKIQTSSSDAGMVGGIAGDCDKGVVRDCVNYGMISAPKAMDIGGIVGLMTSNSSTSTKSQVENCTNQGDVEGYMSVGGIAASLTYGEIVCNCCVSDCTIKGSKTVGAVCPNGQSLLYGPNLSENYYTSDVVVIEGNATYHGLKARGISGNKNETVNNGAMLQFELKDYLTLNSEGYYEIQTVDDLAVLQEVIKETGSSCEGLSFKVTTKKLDFGNQPLMLGVYLSQSYSDDNGVLIEKAYKPFAGTFDGDGVVIKNLAIEEVDNKKSWYGIGLFAYNKGVIKNVVLDESCSIKSVSSTATGGIVAVNEGTVIGCISSATVSGGGPVGGIVGKNQETVQSCTNAGTVEGSNDVGGIVGSNSGSIIDCENTNGVTVKSTENRAGGIAGYNYASGLIEGCANSGDITGVRSPYLYYPDKNKYIAGIVGNNSGRVVSNVVLGGVFTYASAAVVGTNNGTLQNNFYSTNVSGIKKGSFNGDITDGYGAVKGYRIKTGENVKIESAESEDGGVATYKGSIFSASGVTINLSIDYEGDIPAGYEASFYCAESSLDKNEDGTFSVLMGNKDITINAILQVKIGDANGDGGIDMSDVVLVINYILGNSTDNSILQTCDMNNDGEVDIFDVMKLLNVILKGSDGIKSDASRSMVRQTEQMRLFASEKGVALGVDNAGRFTSFQFDVELPDGVALDGAKLVGGSTNHIVQFASTGENTYRVVGLSLDNSLLMPADGGKFIELALPDGAGVKVTNVLFVTPQGDAVYFDDMEAGDIVTSISSVTDERQTTGYDLSGRKIDTEGHQLRKGLYIINNKKVVK